MQFFVTALFFAGNKSGHLSRFVSFCTLAHRVPLDGLCLPVKRYLDIPRRNGVRQRKKASRRYTRKASSANSILYPEQPYAVQNDNQLFPVNNVLK